MGKFPVGEAKEAALLRRWADLGIKNSDVEESFIRAGGHGGQNVNKLSTCVYLRHVPTGTEVKCAKTRKQGMNRYYARVILADKIDNQISGKASKEQMRIEKLRRQKRKRSKRAKEKVLEQKHMTSKKKETRKPVVDED